ncbi:DUF397 domain-containing protein [Embleya hyalina]|uniref:DUF397 domain-containing protein n=1 Tax=Embleya hyalina TaxID=516124 RepID=A0A401YKJ8_9ACTN|nr:DUF397 domain-containing protein [Embleya hyalina]GCD95134.1 hypothetical protein EHYA_02803 [Embleya hyalina]
MTQRNHDTIATTAGGGWRTSSHSGEAMCLATLVLGTAVAVRDDKVENGPVQTYDASAWSAMIRVLKRP